MSKRILAWIPIIGMPSAWDVLKDENIIWALMNGVFHGSAIAIISYKITQAVP